MNRPRKWRIGGPPLALQIMGLLVGGLLVAQLVTLLLTIALPPAAPAQYGLDDIASTLAGASDEGRQKGLQRVLQAGPPDLKGPGWLVSERSRQELAHLMGVEESRVSLAFYTPLPFAGATAPRTLAMANDGFVQPLARDVQANRSASLKIQYVMPQPMTALTSPTPGAAMPPGMPTTGVGPGGPMPGMPFRQRGPDGLRPQAPFPRIMGRIDRIRPLVSAQAPAGGAAVRLPDYATTAGPAGAVRTSEMRASGLRDVLVGTAGTPGDIGAVRTQQAVTGGNIPPVLLSPGNGNQPSMPLAVGRPLTIDRVPLAPLSSSVPLVRRAPQVDGGAAPLVTQSAPPTVQPRAPLVVAPPVLPGPIELSPEARAMAQAPIAESRPAVSEARPTGPEISITPVRRTLFGMAPAPFVEGDFVAALKMGDGKWAVVQPAPEPFPNAWQRRVLLWFAIALALTAPLGWLFARRLVKPIDRFAGAAEQLGRDPAAEIGKLDGPAEIGRAAHAFNLMQNRLRAFVDDRTAMVGAISHDLRTPLTRMRFRIEDVDDEDVREGLLEEVEEMEAMILQVIEFLRDASAPARRERLDLSTIVEDVVEDARLVGGDVRFEHAQSAQVEVDVLGMKRLFDNLLENAVKYGARARIRLRTDGDEAVAEIIDDGPGLPEEEMEHVFEPFYRSESARNSDKSGSGLGLAVCRSIARAHGGEVRLLRRDEGFTAELRVPLVYGSEKALA